MTADLSRRNLTVDWDFIDEVEEHVRRVLFRALYFPIKKRLLAYRQTTHSPISNAQPQFPEVEKALKSGRITYWQDRFKGRFSAEISKELREMGASWSLGGFKLDYDKLPLTIQAVLGEVRMRNIRELQRIDEDLAAININDIANLFNGEWLFEKGLKTADAKLKRVLESMKIKPDFTDESRRLIAKEWTDNVRFNIRGWAQEEIRDLRNFVQGLVFQGQRFGTKERPGELEEEIYARYKTKILATIDPSVQIDRMTDKLREKVENKAHFIARNETRLLMTTYQFSKIREEGSDFFQWRCVVGSPKHPVRPSHAKLNRKIYRWDTPPIDEQTKKPVLPGQAYNCRCTAAAIRNNEIAVDDRGNYVKHSDGSYVLAI
jgi:SPP1 gp7 family putative phage head morphogenesis protein